MILNEKMIENIIEGCYKKVYSKKQPCRVYRCKNKVINSHVVWKKGVLNKMSNDNHLYTLNVNRTRTNNLTKLQRKGTNKVLNFKGFCSFHDNSIFKSVERYDTDYSAQRNQLIIAIRGLIHEIVKKNDVFDLYNCLIDSNIYTVEQIQVMWDYLEMINLGLQDATFYLKEFENELVRPKGRFYFKTFQISDVPVATSTLFQVESGSEMEHNNYHDPTWQGIALNSIFISLIPTEQCTHLIVGTHTNYLSNLKLFSFLETANSTSIQRFLTSLLFNRIESWACSEKFYLSNIEPNESIYMDLFRSEDLNLAELMNSKINMF